MLSTLDSTIVAISLTLTLGVGLWFARRWRNSEEYFLAGRDLVWPLIGLSLFATNISAEHFVGLASGGHKDGLVQGGYEWIASYCLLMLAIVFAPQYLRHKVFTIPEFFERRFGVETRLCLSVYFLAMIVLTKTALATYTGALVIQEFTGWNLQSIYWGIGVFTACYTIAGGLAAVIYTDCLQAITLLAGSIILTLAALDRVGGWGGLTDGLAAHGKVAHLSMVEPPESANLPFSGFLLGNFLVGGMFYWCMDQVNVQRVLGARSVDHARKGAIFAGFLKIVPVFVMVLPGVIAVVLFPGIGDDHNSTYGVLVRELLPDGLRGVVLAALMAALMSSLSSSFNSASTIVARDFVARFRPDTSTRAQIRIGQCGLVAVMVCGVLAAPVAGRYETVWNYLQEITGYLSVPFAVAGLLGVLSGRVNRAGALAAIVVGIASGAFFLADSHLLHWISSPYLASFLHRHFVCAAASVAAMLVVSYATAPPPEEVTAGTFRFPAPRRADEPRGYLIAAAALFVIVTGLWIAFR